jgi:U3 small nucleolar ribonucleoprotein component
VITSDDEEENDDEFAGLSRFEREQRRLQAQIKQLEDFNVSDKPWQLIGGMKRATNESDAIIK